MIKCSKQKLPVLTISPTVTLPPLPLTLGEKTANVAK